MQSKLLNLLVILSSLIGYLEWGPDQSQFLFQAEGEIILRLFRDPGSAIHLFTILPLLGQIVLVVTLFQKQPSRMLTYCGIAALAVLLVFIFIVGVIGPNFKTVLSTLPFLVLSYLTIRHTTKLRHARSPGAEST